MFGLVDGNNFYASCERVFDPAIRQKPVIVLSNNDGCAIARSAEAKALGIKMGQPIHLVPPTLRRQLVVRSANFALYGDMSDRVVAILRESAPRVEVYSIDESFIDLAGIRDREAFARDLRERVQRWTGIPNCIGIAPTKTLAKLANKLAKKGDGVVMLSSREAQRSALDDFPVSDVWGVGHQWTAKLAPLGITTAGHLRDAPTDLILEKFGVVMTRTQRELRGTPCVGLEDIEPDRKQIMVSRSFAARVEDHEAVAQAMATFAVRACEKMRRRGLVTAAIGVFASTDSFRPELKQHHPARTVNLPTSTGDTRIVLATVRQLLRGMLRPGYGYKKAGVNLMDLGRPSELQGDLFAPTIAGDDELMSVVDRINRRFGRGAAGFGASAWQPKPAWGMRQQMLSPNYTTSFRDLPRAAC
ncbi:Y-family DNA polymerase [Pseudoxanthomonas sp. SE1]|uniref:Y-family DNA polymerase n=1 Tax=Pseudoxanthomonas sp. SE1 TaxID=1664560 RepID=UPI00240E4FFA|nr:Y-family DNA polymerase [Pseudoxanthomonas sp. SE1]WFC42306.1 Y-family DNA polymerase [Pseudoxanthomonas sp. SE1]